MAFDQAMTEEICNQILLELGTIGKRIMILVCDQGHCNVKNAKELGISPYKTWITHPFNTDWNTPIQKSRNNMTHWTRFFTM